MKQRCKFSATSADGPEYFVVALKELDALEDLVEVVGIPPEAVAETRNKASEVGSPLVIVGLFEGRAAFVFLPPGDSCVGLFDEVAQRLGLERFNGERVLFSPQMAAEIEEMLNGLPIFPPAPETVQ